MKNFSFQMKSLKRFLCSSKDNRKDLKSSTNYLNTQNEWQSQNQPVLTDPKIQIVPKNRKA